MENTGKAVFTFQGVYLNAEELVEFSQRHMLVLHLPPCVLDGINRTLKAGRRTGGGELLVPSERYTYQMVQEEPLDCFRLKYWK